jgi:cytidyltransferase-like protein
MRYSNKLKSIKIAYKYMSSSSEKLVVVSGHFNPLHEGHVDLMEAAARIGDLCVVVKNDYQQVEKKGQIIRPQEERLRVVSELTIVSAAMLAIDITDNVRLTLGEIARNNPRRDIIFANGGDSSDLSAIPERDVCEQLGIHMMVGVGGFDKIASSSAINAQIGLE